MSNLKDVPRWLLQDKYRFHSIEVLVDNVGGDEVHLHRLLGALQFHSYVNISSQLQNALEFAEPKIAEVVSYRKNFKTAAKSVGRQTQKTFGYWYQEKDCKQSHSNQICKTSQSVAYRDFYKHFSLIMSSNFRYQPFVAFSGNLGGKVPIVDDVLSSHEQDLSY